jgi:transposase
MAGQSWPPTSAECPVRVFCQDESRFGLWPVQRRRVTLSGIKPVGTVPYGFENFSVYGAVEPTTGERFFLELPPLNTASVHIFLNEFAHSDQATLNSVVMDHGSGHTAKSLVIPANVVCLFLPPYSPARNPVERLWREVKAQLAWRLATALEELERQVETIIRHDAKAAIQSLTSYPDFVQAVNALCS